MYEKRSKQVVQGEDTLNGEQLVTVSQRVTLIKASLREQSRDAIAMGERVMRQRQHHQRALLQGTVSTAKAAQLLEHADVVTSDLIPGRYEGKLPYVACVYSGHLRCLCYSCTRECRALCRGIQIVGGRRRPGFIPSIRCIL